MLSLTGGYPSLIKVVGHWWQADGRAMSRTAWVEVLLNLRSVQFRLDELWSGLTQAEQRALADLHGLATRTAALVDHAGLASVDRDRLVAEAAAYLEARHLAALRQLAAKGLCASGEGGWRVRSALLAAHAATTAGCSRGGLWQDATIGEFFQGGEHLPELPNLERRALEFLLRHPRIRHTKSDVIESVWPDEAVESGVMDEALYQVITGLRTKIEPLPSRPCFLVTWRRRPEGRPGAA